MAPALEDLTVENLTSHVVEIGSGCDNERTRYLLSKLIQHCHDFVRETKLTTPEWTRAWQFLTETGQTCTPQRQEMILLSDVLGISALVDAINNPTSKAATESSVLGPFYHPAGNVSNGESIVSGDASGEPMLIRGTVKDLAGHVIEDAAVELWETNGNGFYDLQDPDRDDPDCRGTLRTDFQGRFSCVGVRSVDYPIPDDGPVGEFLRASKRANMRPAHVHFVIQHPRYRQLTTALYSEASPNITADPVFGVKQSLIRPYKWLQDAKLADEVGISMFKRVDVNGQSSRGFWMLENDFILVSE